LHDLDLLRGHHGIFVEVFELLVGHFDVALVVRLADHVVGLAVQVGRHLEKGGEGHIAQTE
jgi:hypothetical protein